MATNDLLSRYKKQKKAEAEKDITHNNSTSDSPFTLSKYREMKKNNQVNYDTQIVNDWFNNADKYMTSVSENTSTQPAYNWINENSQFYADNFSDLLSHSDYVRTYINSLKGTEQYDSLQKQFDSYNENLRNYKDYLSGLKDFASKFNDEEHYNNAVNNIENSETELEKGSKYAAYVSGGKSFDDKKISDFLSNPDSISNPKDFASGLQNLDNGNETLKYWETQDRLSDVKNVDTVPTKEQFAQYQEDSDMLFNQDMEEKYGVSDYDYDELVKAYDSTDDYREKEWLKDKFHSVATPEQLQQEYDKLTDEYNSKLQQNPNPEVEQEFEQKAAEYEQLISKKKQEERVSEFNNLDEETRNIISAKGNINYWSPINWFGGDENTRKAEENFNNLDMSEEDKNKHLETYNRMVESYNAELQHKAVQEQAESNPALASIISVGNNTIGAIPDAFKYIGATFSDDGYINPRATNVSKAQTARATVSENMGGIGSFLYNTGMSMADFTVLLPLNLVPGGQAGSLAVMGTSAGVSSANTVIENGGDLNSAISTGLAAGIAEAFFEKFSLGELKALKASGADSVKKAILKNAFVEGSEEVGTDIANAITDQIINGDMSQLSQQYQKYIKLGYNEDEAWKMCAVDFGTQVGQSFLGGAISGGVLGGGAIGINYATNKAEGSVVNKQVGKAVKENENVNSLIETAKKLSPESKAHKVAVQLEEQQKNNKKVSSSKVGQLRSLIIEQSQSEFNAEYKKVTENLHEDEKAVVDKLLNREALSEDEVKILNDNDVLKNSIADVQKKFNNLYSSTETANKAPFKSIKSIDDNTDKIDETKLKVSENGKTKVNDEIYDGAMEVVRTNPFAETVTYKMEKNGEVIEVNSENIEFRTKEEAKLNALASKYDVQTAQKFFDLYESGQDVDEYSREFNIYQNYGRLAVPLDSEKLNVGYLLDNDQKTGAYEAGLTSRKSYYQEQNILSSNAKNSKYYAYTKGNFNASAIKGIQLDETQRAFYNFFREFALRTGINVELFSSKEISGKYQGEQGSWNKNTKTIRVDINAGLKNVSDRAKIKHGMLNTFSHELTHIAELSGFYDELHEAIVSALEKRGTDFNELVKAKKDELINSTPNAKTMSDEKLTYLADVEVIADTCETMLKNSKIFEDIAQGNPTLAQKLKDKLKNFIARLKQLLNKANALTHEGKLLEECVTEFENIQKLWDKAVTDGIKTANATHAEQKNNTAENSDVRNQSRSTLDDIDNEYLEAVKNNDLETAQKLVDEAAKKAGYNSNSDYQGTSAFNGSAPSRNGYFESKEERIEAWKNGDFEDTQTLGDFVDGIDIGDLEFALFDNRNYRNANTATKESIDNLRNVINNQNNKVIMYRSVPNSVKENRFRNGDWISPSYLYAVENARIHGWGEDYRIIKNEVSIEEVWWDGNYINEWGYDNGNENEVYKNIDNNVKLLNVTYDDNGNVIPLSERFKEDKSDIRYQSRNSLSYDRDLVAVHNLSAENLLKSINLGGFAMPSIAITKSKLQHNDYGEISLIFSKDTIDPETHKSNEVYSGDAWTPTFPKVEYKINERKSSKIYDKLYNLFKDNNIERLFSGLDIDDNNIEYYINNRSNWIQTYRDKSEMKLAYLLDTGKPINMPYKESRLSPKYENYIIIKVAKALGFDVVEKGLTYSVEATKLTDKINSIVDEYYSKEVGKSIHFDLSLSDVDSILRGAYKYLKHGNNKEIDTYALEEEIKKADIDEKDYYKWIDNLFNGIIEKKGLRNNRDLFTSSGNRRSFESLHYEVTLENVVKAMKDEDKKGAVGLFGGSQFYGSSTKNYNSVSEIKKNERRLQSLSEDEYDKIRYGFNERLSEICKELNPDAENSFMEVDRTASILCEAVKSRKTKAGIKRYLSEYQQLTVNDEIVDKIISLVNDIRQMPVKYFEAKPRRAVSFDEVKAAVIPTDTDNAVKEALKELGVPIYEYDSNNENSRAEATQKAINTEYVDVNGEKHSDLLFQMRPDNGFANRRLLANALEKSAQNNYEKNKVKLYKENIDQIDELEARLDEVNEKIKKATSVKAAERNKIQRTELMKLNNVKKILQDKIVRKDKQLLNFESMDVMKKLIESEKKKARHEARINYEAKLKEKNEKHNAELASVKERDRERLADVRESKDKIIVAEREKRKTMVKGIREARDKKEIIRKTIKKIKDIDKLLNRSKADKTVKQGLRDTASKLLSLKDILFETNLSNADIVRRGVETATPEEQKLLDEYLSIIGDTDTELTEAQRRKVYQLNSKLKDLFIRERERLNRATVKQALTELSETYKSVENAPEAYLRNSFDKNIIEVIDNFKEEIGGTLVKDMNVEQVQKLHDIVTMTLTSIRNANKHFAENIKTTCEETSNNVMNEILSVKGTKEIRNLLANKILDFQWRNLKPIYAFRLMGSKTFEKIYWNLQKGELDWYIDLAEAKKFKEGCEEKYGYKSFDFKKTFEFTAMDDSIFTLDLNQMMDIYAASRRPQALQHLLKGGFTFEKDSADGKLKVKTGAKAYPLTIGTIQSIANGLSENEKGYAEAMQKYLSEVMAKKGNEVSMALYGVEMFNEDTYWSISSSDTFLKVEENETTGEFKVKNSGFTKSTIRNASNPIVLRGFEENWCNHVNQMSLYHALTLPLEDFTKVFNYNTGVRTSEENPTAVTGVRSVIKGAFGNAAEHYFRQFMRDLNGGIREASRVGIADNMIALSKKASVFANLSVVLQQPSAIFRATAYVDKRYFLPEVNKLVRLQNHRKDWEQLKKYAPISGIKEMGMFDTGTGKGVLEWLSSGKRDSVVKKTQNKIDDVGSWLPAKADEYAWVKLWHAIQRETRARYGLAIGTEENLVKSGERFNEVVHLTQVYDSVFSRSGAMRSSQTFDKMATSFMAEPTTIMNMAVDAVVQLKRNGKSGIKQFAKSASAILISILANTLLKSIVTAGRDDDEDETYSDKYRQAVWDNLNPISWGSSLNPLNYYPIMRDLMSVFEGYTTERMDMSLVSDFVVSLKKLLKEDEATANNLIDFVGYIANLFGLPMRNVVRDFRAVFNTYNTLTTASKDPITSLEMSMPTDYQEAYDKYWKEGYTEEDCEIKAATSVKSKIRKKLRPVYLEALKNQDSATVANIRRYMRDSGFYKSLNDVDEALKGWRKSSDEEEGRAQRAEERK